MIGGIYRGDFAEIAIPAENRFPTTLGNLRSYWDGRDLTPASGTANNWPTAGGSEGATLINLSSLATITTRNGKRGVVGRMQSSTPAYTGSPTAWCYFYVLEVPTFSGLKGLSAYLGKPLPFYWDGVTLKTARGIGGASFEATRTLVADCSSWSGLLSIAIRHTTTDVAAYWRLNGVADEVLVSVASTNSSPIGMTLGAFADSNGETGAPFFAGGVLFDGTAQDCRDLATWGSQVWT